MKKLISASIFLASFIIFMFTTLTLIYSQTDSPTPDQSEFEIAYDTYKNDVETYEKANNEYIFRRSQYLSFKTLKSQQEAHAATLSMLQARDQVNVSYMEALKKRLAETIGVPQARGEGLTIRLDEEIAFFETHKDDLSSSGTLEDLVKESNIAFKRYSTIEPLFYEVLAVVSQSKISDYTKRTDEMFNRVRAKVEMIRNEERDEYRFSSEKQQRLDRWLFESESRIIRSKEKQTEIDILIYDFARKRGSLLTNYNSVVGKLGETQLLLKESNTFLLEIMREIKTAE